MFQNVFSRQGKTYASVRPEWPDELIAYLTQCCGRRDIAWDFGTGSGQVAKLLAKRFQHVIATDISAEQVIHAYGATNIEYRVEPAEQCSIPDHCIDLVTAGNAIQWVEANRVWEQVVRVGRGRAVVAIFGFRDAVVSSEVDVISQTLIHDVLGPHWPAATKEANDSKLQSVRFPFDEIQLPQFAIRKRMSVDQLLALYDSYSGSQKYHEAFAVFPSKTMGNLFRKAWGSADRRDVSIPVYVRAGHIRV